MRRATQRGLKREVWRVLNDPSDRRYKVFLYFITTLILISVGLLCYETFFLPELPRATQNAQRGMLLALDRFILAVFLLEFLGRLWVIRDWRPESVRLSRLGVFKFWLASRLRFILSPWGLIDFLALLPLVPFLRSLRVLRLLRLFRSVRLFRRQNPLRTLTLAFRDNTILFAVVFGVVIINILLGAVMFFFAEYGNNDNVHTLGDTLWWAIVTISTVGFGDITPITLGGRIIGAALMISGMFVIAMFAGVVSSTLVGHLLPLQMERVRMSSIADHIIIAGWNDNVPMLLGQLEAEYADALPTVVILAPIARPETLDQSYLFVHGDSTKESEYDKVRLQMARTVLVVGDTSHRRDTPSARDATTVLAVFTVRRLERRFTIERARPLHVCAEIFDPENIEHARVAGADEVLATALVGNSLLAHTAVNPGVGDILADLTLATRNNVYTGQIPAHMLEGQALSFAEVQRRLRDDEHVTLIGIRHRGELLLNPRSDHPVYVDTEIVYLGNKITPP